MLKQLNYKNMVASYIESRCDPNTWFTFRMMMNLGYITWGTWAAFYGKCKRYVYNDQTKCVMNVDEIVFRFTE